MLAADVQTILTNLLNAAVVVIVLACLVAGGWMGFRTFTKTGNIGHAILNVLGGVILAVIIGASAIFVPAVRETLDDANTDAPTAPAPATPAAGGTGG